MTAKPPSILMGLAVVLLLQGLSSPSCHSAPALDIEGGLFVLEGTLIAGAISVRPAATLAGSGKADAACAVEGTVSPGSDDTPGAGTLCFSGPVSFSTGSIYKCTVASPALLDAIEASGAVAGTCRVELATAPDAAPFEQAIVRASAVSDYRFFSAPEPPATWALSTNGQGRLLVTDVRDTDSDTMPDWWEVRYFNSRTNCAATVDHDTDGLTSLLEFCLNSDPTGRGPPPWWTARSVINTNAPATNDYAAANQGQLKWIASNAYSEMESVLPDGAGLNVGAAVSGFTASNNYAAVNVGQIKTLAQPFYDRLKEVGRADTYPWTTNDADDSDFSAVNIGQVKHVFSFSISE